MTNLTASTTTVSSSINTNTAIAVHSGIFHCDDVLCVALARLLLGELKVARLDRAYAGDYTEFSYVLDVGMKFDGDRFYDHHQRDCPCYEDGRRHCAASLFWGVKGEQICSSFTSDKEVAAEMAVRFGTLLEGIAHRDNGELDGAEEAVYSISAAIKDFNSPKPFGPQQDEAFAEAVAFAEAWLKSWLKSQAARLPGVLEMKKVVADNLTDSPILALPKGGAWQEAVLTNPCANHIKCVCYHAFEQGQWAIQAVPTAIGSQQNRISAPQELRGAPAGTLVGGQKLVFCHANGFLMKVEAANAAEAIKAAEAWLVE